MEAVKALRLEVAHIHTHVKLERAYEQKSQSWLSGTGGIDVNEQDSAELVSFSKEGKNNAEEKSEVETMSCGCKLRIRDSWGLRFKYKTRYIDCDTEICEGRFRASEPKLMLLESEKLKCYNVE